ncbi:MAG: hypothetical protein JZU52_12635 [Lamprocystis purpurea]|nr:hypothetical protein [Lamprocystis purpurea]
MALTDTQRLDAYRGAGGYADGTYLVRHPRETDDKFQRRQALARYLNYPRKIIDAYRGTLFARPAQRSGEAAAWQALQVNADGRGGQIDDVMRRATLLAMLLGTVYLVVDRPAGASVTRADDAGRMPYVVLRLPGSVARLTLGPLGEITQIVFAESGADGVSYGTGVTTETTLRYRGWDATRWWVAEDVEGQTLLTDQATGAPLTGEHGCGQVPVVRLHSTELLELTDERAAPWAEGVIALTDDLYNLWSEQRDLLRSQTFSILTLPFKDPGEVDRLRESGLTLSTENALPYSSDGGGQPAYVAPPDGPVTAYRETIRDCVARLYELANLEFTGGVQSSGVALGFHLRAADDTLSLLAQALEAAEIACGRLACGWMRVDPGTDLRVVYPRAFQVQDLAARLAEDMDALTLGLGATTERLIRGRAARRVLGDAASPDDYARIDDEQAAGADPYGDRVAAEVGA